MGEIARREIIDVEVVTIDASARSHGIDAAVFRQFVMDGNLAPIEAQKRPAIVMALCHHIGIDPIERPFMVLRDGKREVLYATRACTSALCRERKISREIVSVEERTIAGQPVIVAKARATMISTGRYDEAIGVVPVMVRESEWDPEQRRKVSKGWRMPDPDEASNMPMKAETKAKRRAVLDLVGLGITDESEIETIKGARVAQIDMGTGELRDVGQPPALAEAKLTPTPDDLGPRCSGPKGGPIGDGNVRRTGELADLAEAASRARGKSYDRDRTWGLVLEKSAIDLDKYVAKYGERLPTPHQLTINDGKAVRLWLDAKLAEMRGAGCEANSDSRISAGHASESADQKWVISTHARLCESGECDLDEKHADFARWARAGGAEGIDAWPDRTSPEIWAACAAGLRLYLESLP